MFLLQEAKHIVAAIEQHITFNEFLPLVLGKEGIHEHGLTLYQDGYFDGYDKTINPSAASGFTTAAFRFGHSLLPSTIGKVWMLMSFNNLANKIMFRAEEQNASIHRNPEAGGDDPTTV